MQKRLFLAGIGTILAGFAIGGGALVPLLRKVPDEALLTDPEMRDFAYADGWIVPVRK